MERATVDEAKEILGKNFIGINELRCLFLRMKLKTVNISIPDINFSIEELKKYGEDYILILGIPSLGNLNLSINTFRHCFGINQNISEPCFYNQDWYILEGFMDKTLELDWYLLKKEVIEETRALQPLEILIHDISFPSAILCVYTFFAYYFVNKELLWHYDFIWCSDIDHNGDRIYVGKYHDIDGVNNNGFSIHRHLALRECYGSICLRK